MEMSFVPLYCLISLGYNGSPEPLGATMSDVATSAPAVPGATELSPERLQALLAVAGESILDSVEWDYTGWDGAIMEGKITPGEWRWLRENLPGHMRIVVELPADVSMALDPSEDFEEEDEEGEDD